MTIKYGNKEYLTDNDLEINILGFWPRVEIQNQRLKNIFEEKFGRKFLGGDELISYAQPLVSSGMDFAELEKEILKDILKKVSKEKFGIDSPREDELMALERNILEEIKNSDYGIQDIFFNKTATGIGRGHSLGGLSGVVLGIHGTKMIDSGLTGLCSSRSLVTSSRRRETGADDIAIPESLKYHPDLLKEYMQISKDIFNLSSEFKDKFGKSGGVETFNKVIPYNNPADLFIVLPLDTLCTITSEINADKLNSNGKFVPRELYSLSEKFPEITKKIGQSIMYHQRIMVPRDTYLHYNVFKDFSIPNYALEKGQELGMNINPVVVDVQKNFTEGFFKGLEKLKQMNERVMKITDPEELHRESLKYMYALREFSHEYNESLRIKVADTLSWRVWSEQKRHATLRQNIESVYSGVNRAYSNIRPIWHIIESSNSENNFEKLEKILPDIEKHIVIDDRLKKKPEIIIPYIYHTARQLMFYGKMIGSDFEPRDALYIAPKNIRLRTLENYDLVNLIDLEFPLRLCHTCEPERKASSWKKREVISSAVPELDYFLKSKCSVGFCTEGKYCDQIIKQREYNNDLHEQTKQHMLSLAKIHVSKTQIF